ncbi:MAG: glycosyltransferase [Acutalibacteraceae bacterium]
MLDRLMQEYKNSGLGGVIRRISRYIPSHIIIHSNKKAKLEYGLNKDLSRTDRVVVSLTSFQPRFKNIHLCLKSLLLQSYKPDRIVVWFGNDVTEDMLTQEMRELEQYGVEYRFDNKENLMPHKKYYYAMQEEPEAIIITVDDDAVYAKNTIESLMNSHNKFPDAVCARRVHKIKRNDDGKIASYSFWEKEYRGEKRPSFDLIAVGVGGVLYPPHCLYKEAFDKDKIKKLCLRADDIWLKYMEMLNGTKVVWARCFLPHPPSLEGIDSLNEENVLNGKNDECLKKLEETYGLI